MTQTLTLTPHVKPPVPPRQFAYKELKQGEFWRHIPAYAEVDEATFLDHLWQQRRSVKTAEECSRRFAGSARPSSTRTQKRAFAALRWRCAFLRTPSR